MSLNYEIARYTELTKQDGTNVSISRLGGYLDGYAKGRIDAISECIALARAEIDFESQAEQKRFVEFMEGLKEQSNE